MARYKDAVDYEKPAHEVTITKPFYMAKLETTQEQYMQVMGTNPSNFKGVNLPVEQVSWGDAQEFCKKVSEKTGHTVRLPTEAECEFACRAGTTTTYYSGDKVADLARVAWYGANIGASIGGLWPRLGLGSTHPVGQKEPNAWGLYDMHGNVWEWCADWQEQYKPEAGVDPQGPPEGQGRVLRGGSWNYDAGNCRAANRNGSNPDYRGDFIGFRVVVLAPRTP